MALPATYDIVLYKGDDWSVTLTLKDSNGNVLDLSGGVGSAQVRSGANLVATITVDSANAATGQFVLTLDGTTTAGMTNGAWDFQVVRSGKTRTYLRGNVSMVDQVTV